MPKVIIDNSRGLVQTGGSGVSCSSPVKTWPTCRGSVTTTDATYTLTEAQSGTTLYINKDDGCDVTLPAATAGLRYRIVQQLDFSSDTITVTTASTADIYTGDLRNYKEGTGLAIFKPNGSSNYIITLDGTTTGGVKGGGVIDLIAVSGSEWHVSGLVQGSGSVATPFSG